MTLSALTDNATMYGAIEFYQKQKPQELTYFR